MMIFFCLSAPAEIQFRLGNVPSNWTPPSICSAACGVGLMKKYVEGESCCWTCHNCSRYEVGRQAKYLHSQRVPKKELHVIEPWFKNLDA